MLPSASRTKPPGNGPVLAVSTDGGLLSLGCLLVASRVYPDAVVHWPENAAAELLRWVEDRRIDRSPAVARGESGRDSRVVWICDGSDGGAVAKGASAVCTFDNGDASELPGLPVAPLPCSRLTGWVERLLCSGRDLPVELAAWVLDLMREEFLQAAVVTQRDRRAAAQLARFARIESIEPKAVDSVDGEERVGERPATDLQCSTAAGAKPISAHTLARAQALELSHWPLLAIAEDPVWEDRCLPAIGLPAAPFSAPIDRLLDGVEAVAKRVGVEVRVVGGVVRDRFLGGPSRDLDLVVYGSLEPLVGQLVEQLPARVEKSSLFGTAALQCGEFSIDVAVARRESYSEPAALPSVEPGDCWADLFRRDFTLNTLSSHLHDRESVIDPFGGLRDLEERTLRALHPLSFVDDPTRILRAVALEARFGLRLAKASEDWLCQSLAGGMLGRLSSGRLSSEWRRMVQQERFFPGGFHRMWQLGLHVAADFLPAEPSSIEAWLEVIDWQAAHPSAPPFDGWRLWLAFVASRRATLPSTLELTAHERHWVDRVRRRLDRPIDDPVWTELPWEGVLWKAVHDSGSTGEFLDRALIMANCELKIGGADLIAVGVAPGRWIGEALRQTHAAVRRGEVGAESPEIATQQQLEYATRIARRSAAQGPKPC